MIQQNEDFKKFNMKTFFFLLFTYSFPALTYGPFSIFVGAISVKEYVMTISDPIMLGSGLFAILVLPIASYMFFLSHMRKYDGSEASVESLNKVAKAWIIVNIATTPTWGLLQTFVPARGVLSTLPLTEGVLSLPSLHFCGEPVFFFHFLVLQNFLFPWSTPFHSFPMERSLK